MAETKSVEAVPAPVDPTQNVKELVYMSMRRQDDLRDAEGRRANDLRDAESRRVNEVLELRGLFQEQLRLAEAKRIDAIRAVDVNAVAVASERAAQQANVLATQVAASAEALRGLVATTASTIAQQLAQITSQLTERLAAVEKANYEGQGKSTRDDPVMSSMAADLKALQSSISQRTGFDSISTPLLLTVVSAVAALATYFFTHH